VRRGRGAGQPDGATEQGDSLSSLIVVAHQDVIERLRGDDSSTLAELTLATGKRIQLQTEAHYAVDQYDVVVH